ncbi:MAG: helix-turn-helix domain-containing protein [Bacteroidia bacterium]|jgi:transcriptional regulator with XRE-family HTH domain|nr:helix-turn-helix domain-containing protein [Bacteroidia bacterium]
MIINSVNLRRIRTQKKISQIELAEAVGVSQSTICEWEKNDVEVKLENVYKLCSFLATDISSLLLAHQVVPIQVNEYQHQQQDIILTQAKTIHVQQEYIESLKSTNEFMRKEIQMLLEQLHLVLKRMYEVQPPQ